MLARGRNKPMRTGPVLPRTEVRPKVPCPCHEGPRVEGLRGGVGVVVLVEPSLVLLEGTVSVWLVGPPQDRLHKEPPSRS